MSYWCPATLETIQENPEAVLGANNIQISSIFREMFKGKPSPGSTGERPYEWTSFDLKMLKVYSDALDNWSEVLDDNGAPSDVGLTMIGTIQQEGVGGELEEYLSGKYSITLGRAWQVSSRAMWDLFEIRTLPEISTLST